jgi:hypothetical protein
LLQNVAEILLCFRGRERRMFFLARRGAKAFFPVVMKISLSLSRLRTLGSAALAAAALAPLADARHERAVPAETYAVLQVRDATSYAERAKKHPFTADFNKAGFEEYFAPLLNTLKDESKKNADFKAVLRALEDASKFFTGEILVAFVKTEKAEKGHLPFDFIGLADTTADEKTIEDFLKTNGLLPKEGTVTSTLQNDEDEEDDDAAANKPKAKSVTRKTAIVNSAFQGVTLHEVGVSTNGGAPVGLGGWAVVNKVFVFATAPNVLREVVDAVQNGRKNNLADTAFWKRGSDSTVGADILLGGNLPLATAALRAYIVEETKGGEPNPMFNPVAAYDKLALDVLESLWYSARLTPDEVHVKAVVSYTEKRGLLTLFLPKPLDPLVPAFIPNLGENLYFSTASFDGLQTWKNFETLLAQALPAVKPMLDFQLLNLKSEEGIELRESLLENMNGNLTVVFGGIDKSFPDKQIAFSNSMLFVADVRNEEKLAALINTAIGKIGKDKAEKVLREREYMGVKIRTFNNSDTKDRISISYTLFGGKLFLSLNADNILEKTIAEIKNPQNSAAKNPDVAAAMKRVPKSVFSVEYLSMSFSVNQYCNIFEQAEQLGDILGVGKTSLVNPEKRPRGEVLPWTVLTYGREGANELIGETVLFRKEAK